MSPSKLEKARESTCGLPIRLTGHLSTLYHPDLDHPKSINTQVVAATDHKKHSAPSNNHTPISPKHTSFRYKPENHLPSAK
jgi:hypothetical protein